MARDSVYHYIHHRGLGDLEDFHRSTLPPPEIIIPPHLQPFSTDDEEDIIPNQQAAFSISKATQAVREPEWMDLGLEELLVQGPLKSGNLGKRLISALPR